MLATRWESGTEQGWATRQVAGALACSTDVHVITPQGEAPSCSIDSVFTVHRLGAPIDPVAENRRDLLVEAFWAAGGVPSAVAEDVGRLLDQGLVDPWSGAAEILARLRPEVVVIADHRNVGALHAVDRASIGTPVTLLALGTDDHRIAFPHFDRLLHRSRTILAITETERTAIVEHHGRPEAVHRIGVPLAANPSAFSEPNTWVGETEYILVITGVDTDAEDEAAALGRLLRLRFPDNPVGIVATDAFSVWHQGRLSRGWAVERSSDLARLMAWARVTVDLRPEALIARRCVDSLLYGTPIVVPDHTRAKEHADRGRGGLWFSNPGELTWCVEAVLRPEIHDALAEQGRSYAETEYGSTDAFIRRVLAATGLEDPAADRLPA